MRITEIRYEHKVPVAQYESETLSAVAMLSEADHTEGAIVALKKVVNKGLSRVEVKEEPKKEEPKKEEPKKEEIKAAEPKKEEIKEEPPKADEEKPKKKATKKVAKKPKHTVYDRAEESHKKELGLYLNENFPGWEENVEKAAKLSQSIDKVTPLYDAKGDIMQEFKDAVAEGMK